MTNVIKCVNKDCNHKEPASGREYMYKGRAVVDKERDVLCPICNCGTILINDK
jgi:hypothetical protein